MGAQTWVTISVCPQWHLFVVTKSFRFQSGLEWAQSTNRTPVRAQCKGVTCERAGNHCVKRDGNPSCFRRGIVNRTLGNRTQSVDWVWLSWAFEPNWTREFVWVPIILNRANRAKPNSIHTSDCVRLGSSAELYIEHNPMDRVRLCWVSKFAWTNIFCYEVCLVSQTRKTRVMIHKD